MSRGAGPNAVEWARKVLRRDSGFWGPCRNIAAIDFGTKNCSLAYVTEGDAPDLVGGALALLPIDGTDVRVPTAILLNSKREVEAFGHSAKTSYRNLDQKERESVYYFDGIKMNLNKVLGSQLRTCHVDLATLATGAN